MTATRLAHRQIPPYTIGSGDFSLIVLPETANLTVATAMLFPMPWAMKVTNVFGFLTTPCSDIYAYVDVRMNNTSIFEQTVQFATNDQYNSADPVTFSSWFISRSKGIALNQLMKVVITQIGDVVPGAGLKLIFKGDRDDSITDIVT